MWVILCLLACLFVFACDNFVTKVYVCDNVVCDKVGGGGGGVGGGAGGEDSAGCRMEKQDPHAMMWEKTG